jgi:hypothetical protein
VVEDPVDDVALGGLMKLKIFLRLPQRGQVRGSTCSMRSIRAARRSSPGSVFFPLAAGKLS